MSSESSINICERELLSLKARNQRSKSQTCDVIGYKVWSFSIDNEWETLWTNRIFVFFFIPNELYSIIVLSLVKQKMFLYTQNILLGALSVIFPRDPFENGHDSFSSPKFSISL